jgi:hypothetical protein
MTECNERVQEIKFTDGDIIEWTDKVPVKYKALFEGHRERSGTGPFLVLAIDGHDSTYLPHTQMLHLARVGSNKRFTVLSGAWFKKL